MKIPIFLSCPTSLNQQQETQRGYVCRYLEDLHLEPRSLGRSDYPSDLPLREVLVIARHCSGGIILGFNQFTATAGVVKPGTAKQSAIENKMFATEWNNLEAGILFALGKPLLVFREPGVSGGVFDPGVTDVFVHDMPDEPEEVGLLEVFLKWRGRVSETYYA
jgi:hypothetical protein